MESSQKLPKAKATWSYELRKSFIDLCIEQVNDNQKKGTFFSKEGWNKICHEFNKRNHKEYDKKQMKNHWDNTKADWKVWWKLKECETGLGWDDEKNTVIASLEWWKDYIQKCPDAYKFRHEGIEHAKQLTILFLEGMATGKSAWVPSEGSLPVDSAGPCRGSENESFVDLDSDEEDELLIICFAEVACTIAADYYDKHLLKMPCRTSSYKGRQHVIDILDGHPIRCHELFRMEKHVFFRLVRELNDRNLLQDSREVTVEEQVAIFLLTIGHNERNRKLQEDFQHSGEIISRHFNSVLKAMVTLSITLIVPPSFDRAPSYIPDNTRFWPHFKGCIGAIDGTHIDAIVPAGEQLAYRGRKGRCTQNVMAACSFDMKFTFVWAGWEGSAHDSRILREVLNHPALNFPRPPSGKYYLVDAGYPNMPGFLSPFKKARYHNSAYQTGAQASGKEELFNRRHSSLRNVIERCFGVWKARWPILRCMASYPFDTQRLIVVASMAVHNFIRQEAEFDVEFRRYNGVEDDLNENEEFGNDNDSSSDDEENEMDIVRIAIANSIQLG